MYSMYTLSLCPVAMSAACIRASTTSELCNKQHGVVAKMAPIPLLQCRSSFSSDVSWRMSYTGIPRNAAWTRIMASQGEVPQEILEDSKFVAINNEDPRFGPPAILLIGFTSEEIATTQEMLADMGGDFMTVLLATAEMMKGTLNTALNTSQPDLSQVEMVKGVSKICFLSGLTGEELMMLVRAFPEVGLSGIAFAAHVPKNSDKQMEQLVEEIMGDHDRLSKPRQGAGEEQPA